MAARGETQSGRKAWRRSGEEAKGKEAGENCVIEEGGWHIGVIISEIIGEIIGIAYDAKIIVKSV